MSDTFPLASKVKAILFDCDGTLIDSEAAHFEAWTKIFETYGCSLPQAECTGNPDNVIAATLGKKMGLPCFLGLLAKKRELFAEHQRQGLPAISGTVEFLKKIILEKEAHKLKIGVASAATKQEIMRNLQILGLENEFDIILSGMDDLGDYQDEEGVNKPKPYIYLHAAKLLGVAPEECIVIEDSVIGVQSAVAAGCVTIAVPTAVSKNDDLSLATWQVESLQDFSPKDLLAKVFPHMENHTLSLSL